MNFKCPNCTYDLVGLGRQITPRCPECGADVDPAHLAKEWQRKLSRRWTLFYLTPVLSLPGLALMIVGQPILAFLMGAALCYRALRLDGELYGNAETGFSLALTSIAISLTYTVLTTILMGVLAAFLLS